MTARTAAAKGSDSQAWDDFWAEVNSASGPTEVIRGIEVRIPTDMPINFQQRASALRDSDREDDVNELVAGLFGDGVFQQWVANGMGAREFKVVLAWGMANASGTAVTFREAYDRVVAVEQGKDEPQPANRAARRSQSGATGGRSKPTSRASTATTRKTSAG